MDIAGLVNHVETATAFGVTDEYSLKLANTHIIDDSINAMDVASLVNLVEGGY